MSSLPAIARLCGRHAEEVVLARSASSAFLGLLLALDLAPDAEVILPISICQTMVNAVLLAGAIPVLADCGRNFALDAGATALRLSPHTRAVVFHHPFGRACDLSNLRRLLASRPDVLLVEDCAQSPGTSFGGVIVGGTGDVALFSFGAGKPVDAGVGGAVATTRLELRRTVELALRVGRRGWPDDRVLGVDSTLTPAEDARIARVLGAFPRSAARRIAKVQVALGGSGALAQLVDVASEPSANLFHRLIVDLGAPLGPALAARLTSVDARLWQTAALLTPPYAVDFLQTRYRARGRADLCDPLGEAFPVWRQQAERCLLVRTDASISARRLVMFCRAVDLGR